MVLEADELGCADEVIVIVAGLSIQDPRERPAEKRQQADQQHARFADDGSDFLAYLNLWRYLREQQRELSGNQFRKRCHAEFLHYLRVREWQDLAGQLRAAAREAGVKRNQTEADAHRIHVALLSGLLSHVGMKDAANARVPGRAQRAVRDLPGLRARPEAAVVGHGAELVETSRLWGRDVARILPEWSSRSPTTSCAARTPSRGGTRGRGAVVASERVTLYGLPIVAGRTVDYGAHRPRPRARALHPPGARRGRLGDAPRLRRRQPPARRGGRGPRGSRPPPRPARDDDARYAFFDARIPADVVSGAHFDRWWRDERRARPRPPDLHARGLWSTRRRPTSSTRGRARRPGSRATSSCRSPTASSRGPRTTA